MNELGTATDAGPTLNIVNEHLEFPRVSLVEPIDSRYIHLAATVDNPSLPVPPVYPRNSDGKQTLLAACKRLCADLSETDGVVDATVFEALLRPPGRGAYLQQTDQEVAVADFDVAVLIEVEDKAALDRVEEHSAYRELASRLEAAAQSFYRVVGTNERRIGPVAHDTDGVFLFNYFFAENTERTLKVWEYTAGWFQAETGLDNSTLIVPRNPEESEYTIINHCRWDGLWDVLPALLVKRTFRSYVLANFEANEVAPMPILYTLA
ncbi:MAG: hypothetical protein V5A62_14060 [Haloarculaceae archaeon]